MTTMIAEFFGVPREFVSQRKLKSLSCSRQAIHRYMAPVRTLSNQNVALLHGGTRRAYRLLSEYAHQGTR